MFDVNLGSLQQQAGTYYNSVTDSYEKLPTGAPSYGNGGSIPKQDSIWASIGGVAEDVGEAVESGYESAKSGVSSVFTSIGDGVESAWDWASSTWVKWVLIIAGVFMAVVYVTGKSGVIGQAGAFVPLMV